jgi:TPR repeat protein
MTEIQFSISAPKVDGADAAALFELGCLYAAGRDVELDFVAAHKWFNVAAARGSAAAASRRRELAAEMSAAQIAAAQREARAFLTCH